MMFSKVLFPDPDGPTMATDSPCVISTVIPRSTSTRSAPESGSNRLDTSSSFKRTGAAVIRYVCASKSWITKVFPASVKDHQRRCRDVKSRQEIIHGDSPASRQGLALAHRPRLENIKQSEQNEDDEGEVQVLSAKKLPRLGKLTFTQPVAGHPGQEADWHGRDLVHDDRRRVVLSQNSFGRAAEPDRRRDSEHRARQV